MSKIWQWHFHIVFFLSLMTAAKAFSVNDFYLVTIPKSGSHLTVKALNMLTDRSSVFVGDIFPNLGSTVFYGTEANAFISDMALVRIFNYYKTQQQFLFAHFNFSEPLLTFSENHLHYVKIIMIRDLRDVCIAKAYAHAKAIEADIGPCSFDEKLLYVINQEEYAIPIIKNFLPNVERACQWIQDPTVVVCRFEDLVGAKGGGSLAAQEKQIAILASHLNIVLTQAKLKWITDNLFGIEQGPSLLGITFREGKIGGWKNFFKQKHIDAFQEKFGKLHRILGYNLDN